MAISQERHQQVYFYLLVALAAAIPPYTPLINPIIVIFILHWIIRGRFKERLVLLKQNKLVFIFLAFYALHIISLAYSTNIDDGLGDIEKKIMLFVFPLVLASSPPPSAKQVNVILLAFTISCTLVSAVFVAHGAIKLLTDNQTNFLFYEGLTSLVDSLQPIYFAMYIVFASCSLVHFLVNDWLPRKWRLAARVLLAYFFALLILLSARTALLAFTTVMLGAGYFYARQQQKTMAFLAGAASLVIIGGMAISSVPFLKERFTSVIESKLYFDPKENNANGLTLRLVKWQCSLEGIKGNFFAGVGVGDAQDVLQSCYLEKQFWGHVPRFNSHNQYLQTFLELGFIGFIALILSLILPVRTIPSRQQMIGLMFCATVAICFLTESVLERKQGIIFYGFFTALLCVYDFGLRAAPGQPVVKKQ
jgi:O-antigen ligase